MMQIVGEVIKKVAIYQKNGISVIDMNYWDTRLDSDLFSSLLAILDVFSNKILEYEPTEFVTPEYNVFLNRTNDLILAVIVESSTCNNPKIKARITSLVQRINHIIEKNNLSKNLNNKTQLEWLQDKIHREIASSFPTFWSPYSPDDFLDDPTKIRILTNLLDQKDYTMTKLAKHLNLSRSIIKKKLTSLDQEGFVTVKAFFMHGEHWIYSISERGKLALNAIESDFPGLWF